MSQLGGESVKLTLHVRWKPYLNQVLKDYVVIVSLDAISLAHQNALIMSDDVKCCQI